MKLCFLAGANSTHSKRWIAYFADRGHEIHWISFTPSTEGDIENVKLYLIKKNLLFNAIYIKRLIKKIDPDILHAHYAGVNGVIGAFSGFHPFVLTAWGSDVLITAKSKMKGPLVKFALNKADLITCDAEHMRDAMDRIGVDFQKIKLVYFGVETQKFNPGTRSEKIRSKLGISNSPAIISLRNFEPVYNVESLIQSIPQVLKEIPEAKFMIAGRGSQESEFKKLAKSLGCLESIRFVGWISNDELPQYLASMDIYVSTSLSDAGLAASTAEAMACELPVIITDSGENKKWVKDGENGFIVSTKSPNALTEKIIYLLKNEDVRLKFGKFNRKIIEERNSYQKEMAKMETLYKELTKVKT